MRSIYAVESTEKTYMLLSSLMGRVASAGNTLAQCLILWHDLVEKEAERDELIASASRFGGSKAEEIELLKWECQYLATELSQLYKNVERELWPEKADRKPVELLRVAINRLDADYTNGGEDADEIDVGAGPVHAEEVG